MSTALLKVGTPEEMLAKAQAFREIGGLVESGFFPEGIKSVKQAVMVCWVADSLGVHPIQAIQNCTVIHQRLYFSWRLKWGLVCSRYPDAEMETVEQTDAACTVRARKSSKQAWQSVTFTREQCRKNPVTAKNPLYEQDWLDMSYKACVHRICDRLAPEVLLGLPSGEMQEIDDVPVAVEPGAKSASVAEVLDAAAGAGAVPGEAVRPEPVRFAAEPPAVRDLVAECFAKINAVWGLPLGRNGNAKRKEKCELVLSELRKSTVVLKAAPSPSEANDILTYLNAKYPGDAVDAGVGGNGGGGTRGVAVGEVGASAPPAPEPIDEPEWVEEEEVRNFDEQHADENEVALGGDEPAASPALADAQEAAAREAFDRDGRVETIFEIARTAEKSSPSLKGKVIVEHPSGSRKFYLVHMKTMQDRGRTTGRLVQSDGQQSIDADECRALVGLLRTNLPSGAERK